MPMYEYECEACGTRFEQIRKFSDPPIEVCQKCGQRKVQKLVSSPAIQFKGSGFYITDYARKGAVETDAKTPASTDTKSAPSDSGTTSGSSGSTDTAPATSPSKDS